MIGIIGNSSENQLRDGAFLGEYTAEHDAKIIKSLLDEFFKEYSTVVIRFTPSYKMLVVYPKEAPERKHCFRTPCTVTQKKATTSYLLGYWTWYIGGISDYLKIPLRFKGNHVEVFKYE